MHLHWAKNKSVPNFIVTDFFRLQGAKGSFILLLISLQRCPLILPFSFVPNLEKSLVWIRGEKTKLAGAYSVLYSFFNLYMF